jgi:hypothetical protein
MAVVCFKLAKHFASPSGAYLEYMLKLPEMMKATVVDATFLLWDDPETGESTFTQKKGMTPDEYRAWLTNILAPTNNQPQKRKNELVKHQRHLL